MPSTIPAPEIKLMSDGRNADITDFGRNALSIFIPKKRSNPINRNANPIINKMNPIIERRIRAVPAASFFI